MKRFAKLLMATAMGAVGSNASAHSGLENQMYERTMKQGSLEAVSLFLNTYPDSKHASELNQLVHRMIREDHLAPQFEAKESTIDVAQVNRDFYVDGKLIVRGDKLSTGLY